MIAGVLGATNEKSLSVIENALPAYTLQIIMQAMLYNLIPAFQLYGHKNLALFMSIGQTLLPMFGFWALQGEWIGFFLGQMVVAIVILIATTIIRSKDKMLAPVLLIPKTDEKEVYDVTIETDTKSLAESRENLAAFLTSHNIARGQANRLVLCVEELLKNIIDHGHARYIDVRATDKIVSIHDDGKPFNPLEYKINDNDDDNDNKGFGLRIVNGIGIRMKYDYRFNQNMITINI